MHTFTIADLQEDQLLLIDQIDRSEEFFEQYIYDNGQLITESKYTLVDGFEKEELEDILIRQQQILSDGGKVIGVFSNHTLIGVASVERRFRGKHWRYCKMDILYVSKDYRKMGVGGILLNAIKKCRQDFGADKLYISATPVKNTVDFYLKHGAVLVKELDDHLYHLEPEDIHMEIVL